ncbi:MAG: hypothetical protein C0501_10185 [Isosphaera sp.]|nr:hypothetical protein [Isosphaera sp.]
MPATPTETPDDAADGTRLPAYEATLRATHRAFGRELRRAARALPLGPRDTVLDVPCGDGFYSAGLARRLFPQGKVVAADLSDAFLARARRRFARLTRVAPTEFVKADVYRLPFDPAAFDAVWCARSLISLDDPAVALAEVRRVTRPGGVVGVLEDDEYHRVLVNWPVDLELAVQGATAAAARAKYGSATKLAPGRRMLKLFRSAGLTPRGKKTVAADRAAPFPPAVVGFLLRHLRETRDFVAPHLLPEHLAAFDRYADPAAPDGVFRRPDAELTFLTTLFLARR